MEKTTLYFLCDLVSIDQSKRHNDPEGKSELRWLASTELIPIMKEQGKRLGREDVDESTILERLQL